MRLLFNNPIVHTKALTYIALRMCVIPQNNRICAGSFFEVLQVNDFMDFIN